MSNLLSPSDTNNFFRNNGYKIIRPYKIMDTPRNNETVFITAGIQPSIEEYEKNKTIKISKTFIMQPVLRTQYENSISEGYSIAFVNPTTACFNISYEEYKINLEKWMQYFKFIGLDNSKISTEERKYKSVKWGSFNLSGRSTFYYYNKTNIGKIEIGDSTYYDEVEKNDGSENIIHSLSDTGFGLERLRWCLNNRSYYDLFSDSSNLSPDKKAIISAIGLIAINGIQPSQKSAGYRARSFSKKLVDMNSGKNLNINEKSYLIECMKYWSNFQCVDLNKEEAKNIFFSSISKEYNRNSNSYILSILPKKQQELVNKINVNLPKEEFIKRLRSAKIDITKRNEER